MKTAYISYTRNDRKVTDQVKSVLSENGIRISNNPERIQVGSDFAENLTKQLKAADVVIFI